MPATLEKVNRVDPQGADDDDLAIVVSSVRGRSSCQSRIGSLHDDDLAGCRTQPWDAPLLHQGTRPHDCQCETFGEAEALGKSPGVGRARQYVPGSDDPFQTCQHPRVVLTSHPGGGGSCDCLR